MKWWLTYVPEKRALPRFRIRIKRGLSFSVRMGALCFSIKHSQAILARATPPDGPSGEAG